MIVVACKLDLHLTSHPHSLKEKRMVVRSLKDKLRNQFAVTVAEVDGQDLWQRCILGIASVSGENQEAQGVIQTAIHYIERHPELEILSCDTQSFQL